MGEHGHGHLGDGPPPSSVTAKDVERVIADEFGLRAGELDVSLHYPEAFLLKFKHRRHCEEVVKQGFAKGRGIEVYFIQWRSRTCT